MSEDVVDAEYVVAFTGHRPDKLGGYGAINPIRDILMTQLHIRLTTLRAQYPKLRCISGMALGFDQWAAQVCVDLAIPFEAAVPFKGQELTWPEEAQEKYRELLAKADKVHTISLGGYEPWKMQRRNEWMVDHCHHLIAAWNLSRGGTANCIDYAETGSRCHWENLALMGGSA